MDKIFVNFLPPWVETNIQPAFYDKESGSVLQQTARMYAKVQCLVRMFNKLSKETKETVEEYIAKFVELKDFVDTYFENLDVQQEVNNKIDEMVESGEFDTILANYLVISGGNAKALGCAGDGETDDTNAINTAISTLESAGIYKLVFPKGNYVISGTISVPSDFELVGMKGSVLKYVGDGTSGNIIEIKGTNAENFIKNVTIDGISIDGTEQVYKGGYSMATPAVTHTDPLYKGLTCIRAEFVANIKIKNCNFNEVYGDGIDVRYGYNVRIENNTLNNVSSGNITVNGQSGYDNHGDGIVAFFSFNVNISGNTVVNTRTYQAGLSAAIGKPCGRSGLEFEYALNQDARTSDNPDDITKNPPYYYLIPLSSFNDESPRWSEGNIMNDNYVYGYTKGIHLESFVKCLIKNNRILYCHVGTMCSCASNTLIQGNYFNNENLGKAPQGGYDAYWGGVAISQYSRDERRYGITVSGNSFDGTWGGVMVGSSYVNITGNTFTTPRGVRLILNNLKYIKINDNSFSDLMIPSLSSEDYFIFFYQTNYTQVIGNSFISDKGNRIQVNGNYNIICNNIFESTSIYASASSNHNTVENNQLSGTHFATDCIYLNAEYNGSVRNNKIDLGADTTHYAIRVYGSTKRTDISFNTVIAPVRELETIRNESVYRCTFIGNKGIGLGDGQVFIRTYQCASSIIKANYVDNAKAKVFNATGSFNGITDCALNEGIVVANGYQANNNTDRFDQEYIEKGNLAIKSNLAANATTAGWVVVGGGFYTTKSWTSGTAYNAGTYVKNSSDKVYKVITKGSGDVSEEPTGTSASAITTADGYTWLYMNDLPTFKTIACS